MKRITLVLFIFIFINLNSGFGQNRSINFVEKPWSEIMEMAKIQKKLIFLDGYTTWCGPCKWMAANMFTNDTIGDFYNKSFICAHFDMEKGEGIELAKKYQIRAYPTLLFIDGNGEMVHKRVGAPQKVSDYLEMGNTAMTPGEGFSTYQKKYMEGNREPAFLMKYFERLQGAYMPFTEPLNQYLSTIPEADLIKPDNWKMIYRYVNDMNSSAFIYLQKNHEKFEKLYTIDSVNQKLFNVYLQSLAMMVRNKNFSEANFNATKQQIRETGYTEAEKVIFTADLNIFQMKSEMDKYATLAFNNLDTYYSKDYNTLNEVAWNVFLVSTDTKYLEKAASWAKKSIALKSTPENNDTYANILFKLGDKQSAIKHEKIALELAQKEKVAFKVYEDNLKKFTEF
jgi:thiol-disulfide isomerase/thioredoxin